MQSFTGKELYLAKKDFVVGVNTPAGIITEITDEHCKIGDADWFHFPIQKEICVCEIRRVEEKQAAEEKEFHMDDISFVYNPAKIMNERFVHQDIDDLKKIQLPAQPEVKTWSEYKKVNKGKKKLKKLLEEI
jgi:hypothetical protein